MNSIICRNMLPLRLSTQNLKCNLLLNTNFSHFIHFHSSIHNSPHIAICKFPSKWPKPMNLQHFRHQSNSTYSSSPFPVFGSLGQVDVQQNRREYIPIRPKRRPVESVALQTETLEFSYGMGSRDRNKNTLSISMMENTNIRRSKYINLVIQDSINDHDHRFARIIVPDDAYLVVKVMNTLLRKSVDEEKPPICHQLVNGLFYDYKLEICPHADADQFEFLMETIPSNANPTHKSRQMHIPIQLLFSLHDRMAKMLAKYDRTEKIEPLQHPPLWAHEYLYQAALEDSNEERLLSRPEGKIFEYNANADVEARSNEWIPEDYTFDVTTTIAENDNKEGKTLQSKILQYNVGVKPQYRMIEIELRQGINGIKYIKIMQRALNNQKFKGNRIYLSFPNISVPEDAYSLLNAMCALNNDFQLNQGIAIRQQNIDNSSLICHQMVTGGVFCGYLMEIRQNQNQRFEFEMKTIRTDVRPRNKPKCLEGPIPIEVFHWLKDQMAEMLLIDCLQEQQQK